MTSPEDTPSYDPGFRPNLYEQQLLQPNQVAWLGRWSMDFIGVPVPISGDQKAAVWHGSFNDLNEAPVLAVVVHRMAKVSSSLPTWYAGALSLEALRRNPSENMASLDAAEHGPLALGEALELLVNFVPPTLYPEVQD